MLNTNPKKEKQIILLLLVCITIISLFANPYHFSIGNNSVYIPLIYHTKDESFFAKDTALINHLQTQPYGLYEFMGKVARTTDLEIVYLIGYALILFLIAAFTYLLAFNITTKKTISLLSALIAVNFQGFTLGGFDIIMRSFVQHTIAIPILILALFLFFKKKEKLSMILIGLACYLHLVNGILMLLLISTHYLIKFSKRKIKSYITNYAIVIIILIPLIIKMLRERAGGLFFTSPEYMMFLKARLAHHLFPQTWGLHIIAYALFFILAIYALKKVVLEKDKREKINSLLIGMLIAFGIGTFFSIIYPQPGIMKLCLFRTSLFLKIILIPIIVLFLSEQIENKRSTIVAFGLILAAAANLGYLFIIMLVLFLIELVINKKSEKTKKIITTGITIIIFLVSLVALSVQKFMKEITSLGVMQYFQGGVQFLIGMFAILFSSMLKNKKRIKNHIILLAVVVIIVCVLNFKGFLNENEWQIPHKDYDDPKWDAIEWIRDSTPTESAFLVSPFVTFRGRSLRASLVEFKTSGQGWWDPEFGIEAMQRLEKLGCFDKKGDAFEAIDKKECEKSYQTLTLEEINKLSNEYNLDYALFKKPKTLNLTITYENSEWIIFELKK